MKIKLLKLDPDVTLPEYGTAGAAAFDISANENTTIRPGKLKLIKTGLVFQAPKQYFLAIFARSSTPIKKGLMVANGVGVIDSDYSGPEDEVKILVYNFTKTTVVIKKGDRIAQGIFLPTTRVGWIVVKSFRKTSRGGFGSTGN